MKRKRMLIGVVAAEADNIEQRQILTGIISQAQELELDIAVFTNIYNPNVPDAEVSCENRIYDLILSPDLNALILISESIVNTELQQFIKQRLLAQCHLPIVIIGTPLPDFDIPNARFINTSDVRDITALTNHLIDVHGFTDIDLLTGYDFLEVSRLRVSGYRQALEQHGIPYHEEKVHFGNFWMNTGQELAEKYSSGELPLPQAVVCANDYMAYGLLDAFAELNIRVPEDVTVVGYEYINQRIFHAPILTTYQRNRKEIGRQAVRILHSLLTTGTELPFVPPDGRLISGGSCCCGAEDTELQQELRSCRTNDFFSHMNIYNQMEHRLTECSSLHDFIRICGKSHYLIRDAHDIFLCLSEDWCDGETGSTSDIMSCRSIVPWRADEPAVTFHRQQISVVCGDAAAVYYFTPLFFSDRLFGYIVLKYDTPDSYDLTYRSWIKSVSNALELLRMKNDIRYLSQCQNLSETRDSLTGLYSRKGLEQAAGTALKSAESGQSCIMLTFSVQFSSSSFGTGQDDSRDRIHTIVAAADAFKQMIHHRQEFCARTGDSTFLFWGMDYYPDGYADILMDRLQTLLRHGECSHQYGSAAYASLTKSAAQADFSSDAAALQHELLDRKHSQAEKRLLPNYESYALLREELYSNPASILSAQEVCQKFFISYGHFRATYKACFGISYHQDCILSRISHAKYLLLTTASNITTIAEMCGYEDEKYFLHQFRRTAGCTPNHYRSLPPCSPPPD